MTQLFEGGYPQKLSEKNLVLRSFLFTYKGSTDKTKNKMCVHVEGDGRGGGGAAPQSPPLDLFFSSTPPPSPENRPWQLLGWAPKVMAWAPNF